MPTHFDEAFITQESIPNVFVENDLDDDDRLFDFAAASNNVEAPDDASDDEDGLYDESVSQTSQRADEEELGDEDDADAITGDGEFSWRIEHETGDHKLKGMFDDTYVFAPTTSVIPSLTMAS
jgi:hypothetical protein